jgi:hypothetical protein
MCTRAICRGSLRPGRPHEQARSIRAECYGIPKPRRGIASNLYALGANDKVVQRILRHAKPHVIRERYIKAFDPAVIEAMQKMQATLDALRPWPVTGQQTFLQLAGKLQKPNAGEVAERLKAAVC